MMVVPAVNVRPNDRARILPASKGILKVDGYVGYRALAERGNIELAFCWSHVRRRFYGLAAGGSAPIASEALARINALYEIETHIHDGQGYENHGHANLALRPPACPTT